MTKDINKLKNIQKESYKQLLNSLENEMNIGKYLENIFLTIHGVDNKKENKFNNIIEAREYLNNKTTNKILLEISNILLMKKINLNLNNEETQKFKSSLTLFCYITSPNLENFLLFRNYDKNIVKKIFYYNEEFNIFNKLLSKFFNNETDQKTILLIESEIFEYSQRNIILKNIDVLEVTEAEDLLIKYSEICPLVIGTLDNKEQTKKIKDFNKSLTVKEKKLISKFIMNNTFIKEKNIIRNKEKIFVFSTLCLLLIGSLYVLFTKEKETLQEVFISKVPKVKLAIKQTITLPEPIIENEEINSNTEIEKTSEVEEPSIQDSVAYSYSYIEPTGYGNIDLVNIARSQLGNTGGYPYWSWYGFNYYVDWCGCFASWVLNEAGIYSIPKFARASDGANWFINNSLFRDRYYEPRTGDFIFFDYDYNGTVEHVGIVDRVENGMVYTVEGNSYDSVRSHSYPVGYNQIFGYGTPNY